MEKLSGRYHDRLSFAKVNTDQNPQLAREYEIRLLPTIKVFKKGGEIGKIVGYMSAERLAQEFERILKNSNSTRQP